MWANHPFRWNSLAAEHTSVIGSEPETSWTRISPQMIGDGTHVQLSGNWVGVPRKHTASDDQPSACLSTTQNIDCSAPSSQIPRVYQTLQLTALSPGIDVCAG